MSWLSGDDNEDSWLMEDARTETVLNVESSESNKMVECTDLSQSETKLESLGSLPEAPKCQIRMNQLFHVPLC